MNAVNLLTKTAYLQISFSLFILQIYQLNNSKVMKNQKLHFTMIQQYYLIIEILTKTTRRVLLRFS